MSGNAARRPTAAECHHTADLVVAMQMLATTLVFISLFYFTNSSSPELRKSTWSILEGTTSIVSAIMLSETGKSLVYLVWRPVQHGFVAPQLFYALFCWMVLQLASFLMVHGSGTSATSGSARNLMRSKAFAGTVSRFCAFSWISLWGGLQRLRTAFGFEGIVVAFPWITLCALMTWMLLMYLSVAIRWCLVHRDNLVDGEEVRWEKLASQTEIDAASLCLSYLVSQVMRFYIGGVLPDPGGVEHPSREESESVLGGDVPHSSVQVGGLFVAALSCKGLAVLLDEYAMSSAEMSPGSPIKWFGARLNSVIKNTLHKTTGWLLLFSVAWSIRAYNSKLVAGTHKMADQSVQVRVTTAVFCSYLGFVAIYLLDFYQGSAGRILKFKQGSLQSLVVMVGFSWRRCYGLSSDYVSQYLGTYVLEAHDSDGQNDGELILKIVIGMPIAAVLMPALYWYISPSVVREDSAAVKMRQIHKASLQDGDRVPPASSIQLSTLLPGNSDQDRPPQPTDVTEALDNSGLAGSFVTEVMNHSTARSSTAQGTQEVTEDTHIDGVHGSFNSNW